MVFLLAFGLECPEVLDAHRLAIDRDYSLTPAVVVVQRRDLEFSAPEICIRHLFFPPYRPPKVMENMAEGCTGHPILIR